MPQGDRAVEVAAPAKINLYLHVVGRREDGRHRLDTVFVFPELADTLRAEPASGFSLTLGGPWATALSAESPADNLALTAARRLAAATGHAGGTRLHIEKRVPVAGGLGGGSADAAAALKACRRLWGVDVAQARLAGLAEDLGADVPACLASRPVHASGIGEHLTPLAGTPPWGVLLANPGRELSTGDVFRAFHDGANAYRRPLPDCARWREADWLARATGNDLEAPATAHLAEIGEMLADLRAMPGLRLARMSGSGATCFALFDSVGEAERARERLGAIRPGWWSWAGGFAE